MKYIDLLLSFGAADFLRRRLTAVPPQTVPPQTVPPQTVPPQTVASQTVAVRLSLGLAFGAAAALTVAPAPASAAPLADYLGRWTPERDSGRGLLRLRIVLRDGALRIAARGGCRDGRCLWGRSNARAYGIGPSAKVNRDTRMIVADILSRDNVRRLLLIRLLKGNRLQVQALVRGAKGTTPYYNVFMMKRRLRDVGDQDLGTGDSSGDSRGDASGGRDKAVGETAAEACTVFEPDLVLALPVRGQWRLIHLGFTLKNFGERRWLAERAARLIRRYRLRRRCHADIRGYMFEYWRTNSGIPAGAVRGEDCLRIYPGDAKVKRAGDGWQVSAWDQRYARARGRSEARYIRSVMRQYNASHLCKIGPAGAGMVYLRK